MKVFEIIITPDLAKNIEKSELTPVLQNINNVITKPHNPTHEWTTITSQKPTRNRLKKSSSPQNNISKSNKTLIFKYLTRMQINTINEKLSVKWE